jgi:hypothetical protein
VKRLVAIFVVASVGCGHNTAPEKPVVRVPDAAPFVAPAPDAPPAIDAPLPLAQDPRALAEGLVALYEDVATATGAGDCAAIAADIGALREKHAAFLDALRKADGAAVKSALDPYKDRVRAALDTITTKTAPCGKDPAVERAIDSLFGG